MRILITTGRVYENYLNHFFFDYCTSTFHYILNLVHIFIKSEGIVAHIILHIDCAQYLALSNNDEFSLDPHKHPNNSLDNFYYFDVMDRQEIAKTKEARLILFLGMSNDHGRKHCSFIDC